MDPEARAKVEAQQAAAKSYRAKTARFTDGIDQFNATIADFDSTVQQVLAQERPTKKMLAELERVTECIKAEELKLALLLRRAFPLPPQS